MELPLAREARRLTRPFRGVLRDFVYESHAGEVIELARPYLDPAIRGEPVLSMGRAVEYAHRGFDGLVHAIPFNCMPGTLVEALLERYRRAYPAMPILKLAYDGLTHVGEDTQIEAFIYQARQHVRRGRGGAGAGQSAPHAVKSQSFRHTSRAWDPACLEGGRDAVGGVMAPTRARGAQEREGFRCTSDSTLAR